MVRYRLDGIRAPVRSEAVAAMIAEEQPGRYLLVAKYDDVRAAKAAHHMLATKGQYTFLWWRDTKWPDPEPRRVG